MSFRVNYEDTDSLGIVYHANYLKFMERGRTEYLAAAGTSPRGVEPARVLIVVHSVHVTCRRAAKLGDLLDVVSGFELRSRFRGTFHQRIERAGDLIVDGEVDVVCPDADEQPVSFPAGLVALADDAAGDDPGR